ncbi:MAG: ribonuclease HI [Bacteroidota bacterium]|nr:ribonuclease HI [Candidatus Kapabacteria bacterium]MDW8219344.1 ribonuclease HI [Bacteroidota bacterium]
MKPTVIMYSDGACSGNPGPGGYGVILLFGHHRKELSAGYRKTTNNRMELLGVIRGLETLKQPCRVLVYTDSAYIVNAVNKGWAQRWRKQGWKRNKRQAAENADLWEQLLTLLEQHDVEFIWVRGHAGNTENEHADALAVRASQSLPQLIDEEYERQTDA